MRHSSWTLLLVPLALPLVLLGFNWTMDSLDQMSFRKGEVQEVVQTGPPVSREGASSIPGASGGSGALDELSQAKTEALFK